MPIVAALIALAPVLEAIAGAIAIALAAYTLQQTLQKALAALESTDWRQVLQGVVDLRQTIRDIMVTQVVIEAATSAGKQLAEYINPAYAQVAAAVEAMLATKALPRWGSLQDAQGFRDLVNTVVGQSALTQATGTRLISWANHEVARLEAGVTVVGDQADSTLVSQLVPLPIFLSELEATDWANTMAQYYRAGWLTDAGIERVNAWLTQELARIRGAAPPVTVPPVTTPPISTDPVFIAWQAEIAAAIAALTATATALAAEGRLSSAQAQVLNAQISALTTLAARPQAADLATPGLNAEVRALTSTLGGQGADTLGRNLAQELNLPGILEHPGVTTVPTDLASSAPLIGLLASTGVGALARSMAEATFASAGPSAHAAQQARYGCMGSFLSPLLGVIGKLGPQIAAGAMLAGDNPIRRQIDAVIEDALQSGLATADFTAPKDYDQAVANAAARLRQAISFGMTAQGIAYTAEAITPMKYLGFGQLAGFVGDMAGFKRIADGLMGTIEDAAIYQPLRWEANKRFRSRLPAESQLALMYQKRSLTREELRDYQERLGLPEQYIQRVPGFIFNDPNPGLLIRAFQLAPPGVTTPSPDDLRIMEIAGIKREDPDWYYKLKFAKSGLDDTDVEAFVPVVKMGLLRREQTLRYSQIERMSREGMITRERAEAEIRAAQVPTDMVQYRLAAMDLQREYEERAELRSVVLQAYGKGHLTESEASGALVDEGFDPRRVRLAVLAKKLGLVPRGEASEGLTPRIDTPLGIDAE